LAITYRIYRNAGTGGPVDEATPVATVSATTWASPALVGPGDWTWLVRTYDDVSLLEEKGTQARVRLELNAAGLDITNRPPSPTQLAARATAGGTCRVSWSYPEVRRGGAVPDRFEVWLTAGTTVNYAAAPAGTVNLAGYGHLPPHFMIDLAGLVGGTAYAVGVRAFKGTLDDGGTGSVAVTGATTGPAAVEGLTAVASFARVNSGE